ncbi:hypothetical protein [Streptomyces luteireticuli]|uniref:hypothetical protein n=1 Tax=Streptomyces luteireticuli TaxID=173858 RepID=UPI0031DEDFE0
MTDLRAYQFPRPLIGVTRHSPPGRREGDAVPVGDDTRLPTEPEQHEPGENAP